MPTSKNRHVTFYADNGTTINKLFSFKVNDKQDAIRCLQYFKNRFWEIRAAWYKDANSQELIERRVPNNPLL